MKRKEWPIKTKTDIAVARYLVDFWQQEFGDSIDTCIDIIWDEWPYLDVLYSTDENGDQIYVSIDVVYRFARAMRIENGDIYIHDEYWPSTKDMLEDLKLMDFQSWYDWAVGALNYEKREYEREDEL